MIDKAAFAKHLEWAEDRRSYPYEDSTGHITIGVGRNLSTVGLSDDEIDLLLENDIARALHGAETLPYWDQLDPVRQLVVADMIFNLGLPRFEGFVRANRALRLGDYDEAADEMLDSRWARQVGRRANKLAKAMRSGEWE